MLVLGLLKILVASISFVKNPGWGLLLKLVEVVVAFRNRHQDD
jgi:hypothetical protein